MLVLVVAVLALPAPIDVPVALADHATNRPDLENYEPPEGNLCVPNSTVPVGCIPSPMQCATGNYNGSWSSPTDGRTATCLGGDWHISEYVGGDLDPICGAVISDDRMVRGGWRDPNQMCGAYGVGSDYGKIGNRYKPAVEGRNGAVSSSAPEASAVGIDVLEGGGNAIDAAVAMVFAVGVVAPESCGIGGGGFLLYRGADGTTAALDFRETAPAALPGNFEAISERDTGNWGTGHLVVGVPGTVAGMAAAQDRYGSKPLKRLLEPAIELAERGIHWSPAQADSLLSNQDRLNRYPVSAAQFLVKDTEGVYHAPAPYPVSASRTQPDLAQSLREIAAGGAKAFYRGAIAQKIVAEMERSQTEDSTEGDEGVMTADDLASYRAVWRTPLEGTYRNHQILAMPPPTAGGIVTLATLNLVENWPLGNSAAGAKFDSSGFDGSGFDRRHSSADHLHLLAEAKKLAWADRDGYVADPDYVAVPTKTLISKEYADQRRPQITGTASDPGPGSIAPEGMSTHHISVIDAVGNAVAVTCSIERAFGSAVVVPETGILLNSQLTDFDTPGENKNGPEAGKRPRSSMSPTIVVADGPAVDGNFADGRPRLVLGGFGGPSIPMGVVLAISNVLDHGMEEGHALDAARVDAEKHPVTGRMCCNLLLEDHRVPQAERDKLVARKHTIIGVGQYDTWARPAVQMVGFNPDGTQFAASDPRWDRGPKVR